MPRHKTWREIARPIIQQVLRDHEDCDDATIKKALLEAYPFGERAHHPYLVWLDEIKVQRGKKGWRGEVYNPNQTELF